jgi:predicted NBD/HSP70 family sugar kinase
MACDGDTEPAASHPPEASGLGVYDTYFKLIGLIQPGLSIATMTSPPPPLRITLSGTNLEFARSHNRRVVMEAIRLHGQLTRADIARLTALTPQTISNITSELQGLGFLRALEPAKGQRGQPATPFVIDADGAYSIGLQIDQRTLVAVVVDIAGKVRARHTVAVDRPTPEQALPLIAGVVQALKAAAGVDWTRVLGLGLAVPGPFGVEGLSAVGPTALPGWQDLSIARQVSAAIGLPVIMENDATAAAIGERLHGVARTLRSFTYLFIGTGLGAGMFQDGHLYKGEGHNAGEIGHMIVVPDGRACPCGNRGCLERYVSLQAAYEALGIAGTDQAEPALLMSEDPAARVRLEGWLDEAAVRLRQAVNILESMLDTESIVIGGFLPSPVLARLIERLAPLHASVAARRDRTVPRVMAGLAGHDTAALGAAALPIFDELNPNIGVLLKS